ncbi:MAG: cofactor-independent phosphoglycerate mutase [Euryarchaeota archaeon]|nr:cofactor-independent phosphoglycerate mutase [Euryarchaeota archaeon]
MKYVVVIGDGMADYPLNELEGKTPLQAADIPNMDYIASKGVNGTLKTIPEGLDPGSDVANLSIMGYNPKKFYTGRGPLEAANMGVDLTHGEVAFRCNFINERNGKLADFNADHISTEEAGMLIETLNQTFDTFGTFYLGTSYRNLFVYKDEKAASLKSVPPHDIVGESVADNLIKPSEDTNAKIINKIMLNSKNILKEHIVNKKRVNIGKNPANLIWLWGQGLKPEMTPFIEKYGLKGATITGVDLIKGIGIYIGLTNINVPGATGYYDTDYAGKAKYAVDALDEHDIVFIHVEAPDEAGHAGDIEEKINAIENIDSKIVGKLLDDLPNFDDYSISILPDHATPIYVKTHTKDPIPYAIYSTKDNRDEVKFYDEFSAEKGSLGVMSGYKFMNNFLTDSYF